MEKIPRVEITGSAIKLVNELEVDGIEGILREAVRMVYEDGPAAVAHSSTIMIGGTGGFTLNVCMTAIVGYHQGELDVASARNTPGL